MRRWLIRIRKGAASGFALVVGLLGGNVPTTRVTLWKWLLAGTVLILAGFPVIELLREHVRGDGLAGDIAYYIVAPLIRLAFLGWLAVGFLGLVERLTRRGSRAL
jgi:hypothetical protein